MIVTTRGDPHHRGLCSALRDSSRGSGRSRGIHNENQILSCTLVCRCALHGPNRQPKRSCATRHQGSLPHDGGQRCEVLLPAQVRRKRWQGHVLLRRQGRHVLHEGRRQNIGVWLLPRQRPQRLLRQMRESFRGDCDGLLRKRWALRHEPRARGPRKISFEFWPAQPLCEGTVTTRGCVGHLRVKWSCSSCRIPQLSRAR